MASSLMSGASSSCSAAFSTRTHPSSSKSCLPLHLPQKTNFHGLSLQDAKRVIFSSLVAERMNYSTTVKRGLEIKARTTGASKTIEVEVDKPLGLTLGQKPGGGVVITAVDGGGNAAKAGLKSGDQVIYTSSFFGDELWPADKLGFTKTAIQAKPDSVYFVVSRGADVDVKKLPKRPAPPRFGRKLTEAQKPDDYACPQCRAPKKRFARYDVNTGKAVGGALPPIGVIIGLVAGLGAVGALLVYGLQ
uniref:PDZ domain-containing protein n=1 Tax=Chenopodium quinoa TaxID=63459 RepID=A0A803L229_CHEQI